MVAEHLAYANSHIFSAKLSHQHTHDNHMVVMNIYVKNIVILIYLNVLDTGVL